MTDPRILHAAARGARLQWNDVIYKPRKWKETICIPQRDEMYEYRVHPDDAHLMYGPVSTALREAAKAGNAWDLSEVYGSAAMKFANDHGPWFHADTETRSMFLLILAEALSFDGL